MTYLLSLELKRREENEVRCVVGPRCSLSMAACVLACLLACLGDGLFYPSLNES